MRPRIQRFRLAAAAGLTGALLVPLAVFAGPGLAKSPSAAQYQYKITICHHTHSAKNATVTINVSVRAWPAHKKHGDTIGPCAPPTTTTSVASSSTHDSDSHDNGHGEGKNGSHGNSASHGNGHDD